MFVSARLIGLLGIAVTLAGQPAALDYGFFREKVEPILLKKRPGLARCVTCHEHGVPPLEPLAAEAVKWTEEQSRKNFAIWKQFVVPGAPEKSRMLLHPLAREAGGDKFHAGGRHFKSKNDTEWQTMARWVKGEKI